MTACHACRQPITLARTTSGRVVSFDPQQTPDGTWTLNRHGLGWWAAHIGAPGHTRHQDTCKGTPT